MKLRNTIMLINTAGLLLYLAWLVFGRQRILYTQAGVLFLLPCLPFFFIYFFLSRKQAAVDDDDEDQ
ncbi:MAG TPA: hypothetical protein PJ991_05570 [Kiritimatiellia bacterium]|nr:hypothetical protein [Kiritimatiellia bacterium]